MNIIFIYKHIYRNAGDIFCCTPPPLSLMHAAQMIVCSCTLISIVAHCAMLLSLPLLLLPATCAFAAGNCSRGASKQQQTARQRESATDAGVDGAAAFFFFWLLVWPNFIFTLAVTHTHTDTPAHRHTHTHRGALTLIYTLLTENVHTT